MTKAERELLEELAQCVMYVLKDRSFQMDGDGRRENDAYLSALTGAYARNFRPSEHNRKEMQ